jgi:hypothetical protein
MTEKIAVKKARDETDTTELSRFRHSLAASLANWQATIFSGHGSLHLDV